MNISAVKGKEREAPPIVCTIEYPTGSGCKCGKPSFDGKTARCIDHKDDDPSAVLGLESTGVGLGYEVFRQKGHRKRRWSP